MITNLPDYLGGASLLRIVIIIFVALFCRLLVALFLGSLVRRMATNSSRSRVRTLSSVLSNIITSIIWLTTFLIILKEIGIDITPIIASAGVVGVAVAFGAQTLVKDWLSGFFLLIEDQFREGEVIEIGDHKGEVEKAAMRAVTIRKKDGQLTTIPYSSITSVTNHSRKNNG